MSLTTHIKTLHDKHKKLEDMLHYAYINHLPTDEISNLKKKKLKLKDEITFLEDQKDFTKKAA